MMKAKVSQQPEFIDIDASDTEEENMLNANNEEQSYVNQNFIFTNGTAKKQVRTRKATGQHPHLHVNNGLNLKAKCTSKSSPNCVGKDNIWLMLGYGQFNIGQIISKLLCPVCKQKVQSSACKSFGYKKAKVTIKGNKIIDGQDEPFDEVCYSKGNLFTKHSDVDENMSEWTYLKITVEKH